MLWLITSKRHDTVDLVVNSPVQVTASSKQLASGCGSLIDDPDEWLWLTD